MNGTSNDGQAGRRGIRKGKAKAKGKQPEAGNNFLPPDDDIITNGPEQEGPRWGKDGSLGQAPSSTSLPGSSSRRNHSHPREPDEARNETAVEDTLDGPSTSDTSPAHAPPPHSHPDPAAIAAALEQFAPGFRQAMIAFLRDQPIVIQWKSTYTRTSENVNDTTLLYSCRVCRWPETSLAVLLRHVRIHNPDWSDPQWTQCRRCGVWFGDQTELDDHDYYDHYDDLQLKVLSKSGFSGLTTKAQSITKWELPLNNLLKYRAGTGPSDRQNLLEWIVSNRSDHYPGLIFRRIREETKNGERPRVNSRVVMFCCSCGEPRFSYRQIGSHILQKHADSRFHCTTCTNAFSSRDNLKRHWRTSSSCAAEAHQPGGPVSDDAPSDREDIESDQEDAANTMPVDNPAGADNDAFSDREDSIFDGTTSSSPRARMEMEAEPTEPILNMDRLPDDPERAEKPHESDIDPQVFRHILKIAASVNIPDSAVPSRLRDNPLWSSSDRIARNLLILVALGFEQVKMLNDMSAPAPPQTADSPGQPVGSCAGLPPSPHPHSSPLSPLHESSRIPFNELSRPQLPLDNPSASSPVDAQQVLEPGPSVRQSTMVQLDSLIPTNNREEEWENWINWEGQMLTESNGHLGLDHDTPMPIDPKLLFYPNQPAGSSTSTSQMVSTLAWLEAQYYPQGGSYEPGPQGHFTTDYNAQSLPSLATSSDQYEVQREENDKTMDTSHLSMDHE